MATVNIGSLKFNWKGTYNGSTAYAIDDVTEYNGSSYICILASTGNLPTNTTYFQPMATKGTDGTDVGTTLTTQGDILYRDGSGLQRLAKGTANQVLKMNAGATAPEYGNLSSDFVKLIEVNQSSSVTAVELQSFISSTYKNYKVILNNVTCNTSGNMTYIRMMTGTNTQYTAGNYYNVGDGYYRQYSGGTGSSQDHFYSFGTSYARFTPGFNNGTDWGSTYVFDMYAEANKSVQITGNVSVPRHGQQYYYGGCFSSFVDVNTQNWTGLYIYMGNGDSITNMDVTVYGLKD